YISRCYILRGELIDSDNLTKTYSRSRSLNHLFIAVFEICIFLNRSFIFFEIFWLSPVWVRKIILDIRPVFSCEKIVIESAPSQIFERFEENITVKEILHLKI